jgi:hypothetical protein
VYRQTNDEKTKLHSDVYAEQEALNLEIQTEALVRPDVARCRRTMAGCLCEDAVRPVSTVAICPTNNLLVVA